MSYQITLTNGNILVTVPDTQLVSTYGGLDLIGKNFAGFGTAFNNDLVHIVENFADTTPPNNPLLGQIWYDTISNALNFWNGTEFKPICVITCAAVPPLNPNEGDQWFDTSNQQLNLWNSIKWVLIGPTDQGGNNGSTPVSVTFTSSDTIFAGPFEFPHGLNFTPSIVIPVMTSDGRVWLNQPVFADATNIYLVASDPGVSGLAICYQ